MDLKESHELLNLAKAGDVRFAWRPCPSKAPHMLGSLGAKGLSEAPQNNKWVDIERALSRNPRLVVRVHSSGLGSV